MINNDDTALMPCSCGRTNGLTSVKMFEYSYSSHPFYVACTCGMRTQDCKSEKEAREIWNTRTPDPALIAVAEGMAIDMGRIANHFDQDVYENGWKSLALEMADVARQALAAFEAWKGKIEGGVMQVFILYKRSTYEGCSEPLACFDTLEKAEVFKSGYEASYQSDMEIMEMQVK